MCYATSFLLLLAVPAVFAAQDAGPRVRLTTAGAPALVGTLVGSDADSLRLRIPGEPTSVAVARSRVRRLEISRGWRRATVAGAALLAPAGALAGAVLAGRSAPTPRGYSALDLYDGETRTLTGAWIGGAIGLVVGAVIGSQVRRERWEDWPQRPRLVAFTTRGAGLGLTVAF